MTWNYRIIRYQNGLSLGLHEVYYEKGNPSSMTEKPCSFVCDIEEGKEGIIRSLEMALTDAKRHLILDDPWPSK